jgi:hypothetical protein
MRRATALSICHNRRIGAAGYEALAAAIRDGGAPRLERLRFDVHKRESVPLRQACEARAIATILASGRACTSEHLRNLGQISTADEKINEAVDAAKAAGWHDGYDALASALAAHRRLASRPVLERARVARVKLKEARKADEALLEAVAAAEGPGGYEGLNKALAAHRVDAWLWGGRKKSYSASQTSPANRCWRRRCARATSSRRRGRRRRDR